uniref:Arrestin C-terminal-like domain-containing protein n=1 Tax=Dicentrarchus labrax TaxID=13489 RepID=A0A8P4GJ93_DICLA
MSEILKITFLDKISSIMSRLCLLNARMKMNGVQICIRKTGLTRCACWRYINGGEQLFRFKRLEFPHGYNRDLDFPLCISLWKMTIKNFSIEYDAINSLNTFTNGDTINGRIIVEVSKESRIHSLIFIGQGKARVCWSEHYGQYAHCVYWADEKYYNVKHHILRDANEDGTVIGKGRHVFPFSFKIPDRTMPSSFKTSVGKIVHKLKAELKQSMKRTKKAKIHFTFISKADMDIPGLMEPQYSCKDKSLKLFGSGTISMDVHTKQMGYKQGEAFQVTAEINNCSSRSVKPKFILYEKKSFFAQGRRRVCTNEILKEKFEAVESSGKETVTKVINIPRELPPSILNCSIIKLEYRLKVHLDVKCASDPEIKLPIVILPASEVPAKKQPPASDDFGFEAFASPKEAPRNTAPQRLTIPQQHAAPLPVEAPPTYATYAMYPTFIESDKYHSAL